MTKDLVRIPRSVATQGRYHGTRTSALNAVIALSALAGDTSRLKRQGVDVFGQIDAAGGSAKAVDWGPLQVTTTIHHLGVATGLRRDRDLVAKELASLGQPPYPGGVPLLSWKGGLTALAKWSSSPWAPVAVTISADWHCAVRGGRVAHAYVDPDAYASLRTSTERRAYVWLAGWAGIHGPKEKPRSIKLDTLISHLWPASVPSALRMRRSRTRAALGTLNALPGHFWTIRVSGDVVTVVRRPLTVFEKRDNEGWRRVALMIPDAEKWRESGHYPGDAAAWYVGQFDKEWADECRRDGCDPESAEIYRSVEDDNHCRDWKAMGEQRDEEGWRRVALMIPDAEKWREAGLYPPEAARWYVAQYPLEDAVWFREHHYDTTDAENMRASEEDDDYEPVFV